ncbi:hypothetical protein Hdeb2414_s0020g00556921 [Helianthus debilis subsp. tardiflorus]
MNGYIHVWLYKEKVHGYGHRVYSESVVCSVLLGTYCILIYGKVKFKGGKHWVLVFRWQHFGELIVLALDGFNFEAFVTKAMKMSK